MQADAQEDAISFLKNLGAGTEVLTTHASCIFLVGDRAYKLKKAVTYAYLDFSTVEKRLEACRTELALNRRTAPSLYLDVRKITREPDGALRFDGSGAVIDAVVEMRRFDQDVLLDRLATRGQLTPRIMSDLACQIAALHRDAAVSFTHGGSAGLARVLDINARSLAATQIVSSDATAECVSRFQAAFERLAPILESRRRAGKVRRCHGDLILRNICLLDGTPVLFDCLEFDEELATIDVLYDLAFLLMDLWHRGQPDLANFVFNRYLDDTDETDGLALLPFFMAVRAAVRAHVTAAQAQDAPENKRSSIREEARAYLDLAQSLLRPSEPVLLAIGGFSGSGKSTVAARIAPHVGPAPGARVLNTDRIRKALHHVPAEQHLEPEAYRPEVSRKVYGSLRQQASDVLSTGSAVIADAVFDRLDERLAIEDVARSRHARFTGVWLEAPAAVLLPRIAARRHDPSDATADVLKVQLERECGEIRWNRLDAAKDPSRTGDRVRDLLSGSG